MPGDLKGLRERGPAGAPGPAGDVPAARGRHDAVAQRVSHDRPNESVGSATARAAEAAERERESTRANRRREERGELEEGEAALVLRMQWRVCDCGCGDEGEKSRAAPPFFRAQDRKRGRTAHAFYPSHAFYLLFTPPAATASACGNP